MLFTANCCFTSQKGFIRQAPVVGQVAVGDRAHDVEELLVSETKPGVDVIKLFCPQITDFRNKLECLSLVSFSSIV